MHCTFFPFSRWKFCSRAVSWLRQPLRQPVRPWCDQRQEVFIRICLPNTEPIAPLGVTGLPAGPSQLPYPLASTPANDAWVRNNAWAAYNETCTKFRLRRTRIVWQRSRILLIKIGSSRSRTRRRGIISSLATTKSALCKWLYGEWEPIPGKSMEYLDLTRSGRSKSISSETSGQ